MRKRHVIEIVLFCTYAVFAMMWKSGDFMIAKLKFDPAQVATMTNAINIAKVIGCLVAAAVILKLGNSRTYIVSTILIILGALLVFTNSFPLIFLIRFILGLGGALVLVTINPIVAALFPKNELPIVNGLNAVAFNTGLAISLTMSKTILANPQKWIAIFAAIEVVCLLLWIVLGRGVTAPVDTAVATDSTERYSFFDGLKEPFNIFFALAYCGLLGFYLVAFTFMKADTIMWVIWAGVLGALVGTFGTKAVKDKLTLVRLVAFLQLLAAVAFLFFYNAPSVKVIGFILGFLIFLPMPAFVTLAYLRPGLTPRRISVTFSIFWSMSYLISVVIVQVFGMLQKASPGSLTGPFIFIAICEAMFFIGTAFLLRRSMFTPVVEK